MEAYIFISCACATQYILSYHISVGLTKYGTTVKDKPEGTILKCPDIKPCYGVSNLTAFIKTG